ncbi:MAG TPA: protein kinase [Vicinamibacterales bacterium]
MNARVEHVFHQVADLPVAARMQYFTEHAVDEDTRREVEALLVFDPGASARLQYDIGVAASRALPMVDASGWSCGPYRLLHVIGRGGMGAVYLAERVDGEVIHRAAVKLLPFGAGDRQRERFLQERQILATVTHPNVARLLDAGHLEDGQPFLVMEYVDGQPIDAFTAGWSVRRTIALFLDVCAAVAHLHRHLIVHRDLKPGNILVTADGEPKLLDFGIATLLELRTDPTMTGLRMLTPSYASPEQITGGEISTASDIYSLGALLYRLLAGRSPHDVSANSAEAIVHAVTTREIERPSRTVPELKGDVDAILLKALRRDPRDRYTTVEHFADDLQAFLASRPVRARSGNAWYRARKFFRRHWVPSVAAAAVIASLAVGLYIANRERTVAQRRFDQVRRLATRVLALDASLSSQPGVTKTRQEIVAMSKEYLEGLVSDAGADPALALELGTAYLSLAGVQGVPTGSNLGSYDEAEKSLIKAESLLESVIHSSAANRAALLKLAEVSHDRMILADAGRRPEQALSYAKNAAERLERWFDHGDPTRDETRMAFRVLQNIALAYKNNHRYDDSIRYARRAIEISRSLPDVGPYHASSLSLIADALRLSGDLEGALNAITDARRNLETSTNFPSPGTRLTTTFNVLWRQGVILGGDGQINLGRPDDAVVSLQAAFDLIEDFARTDADNASSRILFSSAGRELGNILSHREPERALAIYTHALRRLREIKNNTSARRGEAELMAASSYVLRRLERRDEARMQIEAAFQLLRETKAYPADRVVPGGEVDSVLRSWADHLADTNQSQRAAESYQELLDKVIASRPDPQNDLRDATALSRIYESLGGLHARNGNGERANEMSSRRLEIWREWNRKLPQNPFIRQQLQLASTPRVRHL